MRNLLLVLTLFVFNCSTSLVNAAPNNALYEQRRVDYNNNALANFSDHAITIQAYMGVPVDSARLHEIINGLPYKGTVDFDLVQLVRILFLSNGQYDTIILPAVNALPFWLTKSDTLRGYWSENHMIQWMSSDWLLHEKYGKPIDASLDNRLRHYLRLKVNFGFYEFFSSVYAPYCLSGLLNLADFSQDAEIKMLATQASQLLLKDLLMLTNDKGVFFPVAGRNYYSKYETAYQQNHNSLIYLLTGFGEVPTEASHAGGFLSTSTLAVDSVIDTWQPSLDVTYHIGHTLDTGFIINSTQTPLDKTLFQWSSGAYFHPDVAAETAQLLTDSNLWHHIDFAPFVQFSSFPIPTIVSLSNSLSVASKSTVICGQDVVIYKHNSLTLSSIKEFWKGKLGFQQFPCVANVGTTAVFTASGPVTTNWDDRPASNANDHLPSVVQNKNLALIMYRPEFKSPILPYHNPEVALHFNAADFDEITSDSLWLLGRQQDRYVAVRRHCADSINNIPACLMDKGQVWVIMLGDSVLYGSFQNFQNMIAQSSYEEKWYLDTIAQPNQWVYYAKITADTLTAEYAWGTDSLSATGVPFIGNNNTVTVYPNPAEEVVNIVLPELAQQSATLKITNAAGQLLYSATSNTSRNTISLSTADWPAGFYIVTVETASEKFIKKLVHR